jgi:hypothetical protein
MPVFMIERRYAEQLDLSADELRELTEINDDEEVRWLYSFLSWTSGRRTACTTPLIRGDPPGCGAAVCPRTRSSRSRQGAPDGSAVPSSVGGVTARLRP